MAQIIQFPDKHRGLMPRYCKEELESLKKILKLLKDPDGILKPIELVDEYKIDPLKFSKIE